MRERVRKKRREKEKKKEKERGSEEQGESGENGMRTQRESEIREPKNSEKWKTYHLINYNGVRK